MPARRPLPASTTTWALVALIVAAVTLWAASRHPRAPEPFQAEACGAAAASSCGALDPVDDPAYNMREVAKQTLLLEQHLAEPRKLCRACSVKHLMLCCGLLEEAAWMAGTRADEYPLLRDTLQEYDALLRSWPWRARGAEVPDQARREILAALRARRRQLVDEYVMVDGDFRGAEKGRDVVPAHRPA